MAIEVGKDAVVIKNHSDSVVKIGEIYEVLAIKKSDCRCCDIVIDIGKSDTSGQIIGQKYICPLCGIAMVEDGIVWLYIGLFAPIDEINIDELTEVLNQNVYEV